MPGKISLIIAAKNEEGTVADIISVSKAFVDEIVIMDGHSTDRTKEIAQQAGCRIILDNNKGKGAAIRMAISEIETDIFVFMDADGSHHPQDIPLLVKPILENKADLVIGSRAMGGSDELHGTLNRVMRLLGAVIITMIINWRFKTTLSESQNGFRAIKASVAKKLNLQEDITTIEQEMLIKALKKGYSVSEVPSHEHERKIGQSRISLGKTWFRYIYSLFKYLV